MWLLLVPLVIVLGLLLMGGALIGAVFGLLGPAWPLILIAVGAWMFWHNDGPHRRHQYGRAAATCSRSRPQPAGRPAVTPIKITTATPPDAQRPSVAVADTPELPIDVQVKVEQIRRKVEVLLGFADRFPPFSQDLFLVRQTASEYLPRTIDTFLSLPRDSVDKPLTAEGKTPLQELRKQLELLDSKLDEIAQALQRQDVDRLLANRRFLEERFGRAAT